jgi:predicted HAD superfamily Cof-like phosphohydrolase
MEKRKKEKDIVEMIKHWSETFGLPVLTEEQFPEVSRAKLALDLIDEEFLETAEAVGYKNFKGTKDGLGDLLWVTIRAMMEFGIDPHEVISKIYESNMSKADVSEEDATITYKRYLDQNIQTYSKKVGDYFITYRLSDNKVLKSHRFQEPDL